MTTSQKSFQKMSIDFGNVGELMASLSGNPRVAGVEGGGVKSIFGPARPANCRWDISCTSAVGYSQCNFTKFATRAVTSFFFETFD